MPFVPDDEPAAKSHFTPDAKPAGGRFVPDEEPVAAAPRVGAAAIPTEAEGQGQPYTPPAPVAPAPPTFSGKVTGAVEAGLNLATSLIGGFVGYPAGIAASGMGVLNQGAQALTGRQQTPAQGPLDAGGEIGQAIAQSLKRAVSGPMDLREEQGDDSKLGEKYTTKHVDPFLAGMQAVPGLGGEFAAMATAGRGVGHQVTTGVREGIRDVKPAVRAAASDIVNRGGDAGAQLAGRAAAERPTVAAQAKIRDAALNRPELESIRAAHDAGFKLTPKAAQAGLPERLAETAAGSARLAQELSAHNADNVARLARKDVGLADDVPATPEATIKIRNEAGQDYAAVKDVGKFENDAQYHADLDSIVKPITEAAKDYPESKLADHPVLNVIEGLRTEGPISTASAIEMVKQLRSKADVAFRGGDKKMGGEYRAAAAAIDNSMDRALGRMAEAGGDPALADAVGKYREARVRIAKTYLLDDAMDGKPGEVNGKVYARALDKGVKLDGPALQIAQFAKNFGGEGLVAKKSRSGAVGPTYHDLLLGALMPHAAPGIVAMLGRPGARAILGSERMQKRMAGSKPLPAEKPAPPAPPGPPPEPTTSPGAGPGAPPSGGGGGPGPLGDLTPDWGTTPGAGGGPPRGGHEPGLVRSIGEVPPTRIVSGGADLRPRRIVTPEGPQRPGPVSEPGAPAKRAGGGTPAAPGRPDLPDTMVVGRPKEVAASDRSNAAMDEPGARVAREQQGAATTPAEKPIEPQGPDLAEVERLRAESESPAVQKVLADHEKALKAEEAKRVKAEAAEKDAQALEKAALQTTDAGLRDRLRAQAEKLRKTTPIPKGEVIEGQPEIKTEKPGKIPVGKATEGQPEIKTDKPGKMPTGEATEIKPERVEPAPEMIPTGETYDLPPEQEAAWRKEFGLGEEDAARARDVARAHAYDPKAVEAAAVQHEKSPRAFDREIARINEEAKNANEAKSAAESGKGVPEGAEGEQAAKGGGDDTAGAARGATEPAGADGARTAEVGPGKGAVEVREVPGGFEAYRDGKKIGYLKDNLERGQAKALDETANVDMVNVDASEQGKGEVGPALYKAFEEKHEGRIAPSGKTEPNAWKLWKKLYPEKVDEFVKQEAARIRDGADQQMVLGNIKDPEVADRVARRTNVDRQRVNVPGQGVHTQVTLSDGVHRIQRLNSQESMGLPGWHDIDVPSNKVSYLADTEGEAIKELQRKADAANTKPDNQPGGLQQKAGEKGVQKGTDAAEEVFKENPAEAQPVGSPEALDKVLREKFGDKIVQGLLDQGVLKFARALDEGMGTEDRLGVKAVMREGGGQPSAATLYFDRLPADMAPGVLMHELGEHFGVIRLLGPERYDVMLGELRALRNTPEVRAVWKQVQEDYVGERTATKMKSVDDPRFMREVAARLVENHPDLPFVRRLISEIRAFFYEKFGTTLGNRADASLIRGLAASALRKASKGGLPQMRQPVRMLDQKPLAARPAPSGALSRAVQ